MMESGQMVQVTGQYPAQLGGPAGGPTPSLMAGKVLGLSEPAFACGYPQVGWLGIAGAWDDSN